MKTKENSFCQIKQVWMVREIKKKCCVVLNKTYNVRYVISWVYFHRRTVLLLLYAFQLDFEKSGDNVDIILNAKSIYNISILFKF